MSMQKDAKLMAKSLRVALADRNVSLSYSECLELTARQLDSVDWNTLSAKLRAEDGRHIAAGPDELPCSFCGKSRREVGRLFEGGCVRPGRAQASCVFICDECVTFCAKVDADLECKAPAPQASA